MKTENNKPLDPQAEGILPTDEKHPQDVEEAWPMGPDEEDENIRQLKEDELDLVSDQLERFGRLDPKVAARGYRNLIETNPDDRRIETWKGRLAGWEKSSA